MTKYSKSVIKINESAAKAYGFLLAKLDPDSNAFRHVTSWYREDASEGDAEGRGRKDFNFRNMWRHCKKEYKPDNEINLGTFLKKFENLTDEGKSSADFSGQYTKLVSHMTDIAQPPTGAEADGDAAT